MLRRVMKKYESIRIFKSPVLEAMTHVHPVIPLVMWTPFVLFLWHRSFTVDELSVTAFALWGSIGLVVWTLTEYVLHRYVFHWNPKHALGKRFVFLFHGLHHDDPNDPTRLVMPPVPAILIMFLLWNFFALMVPNNAMAAFMSWFTVGYLCYDYIHYATHHFKMTSRVGRYLKKWHIQHHFRHEKARYGVSSPLWDYIFRTVTGPKEDA